MSQSQDRSIARRWRARLGVRRSLLAVAHRRYVWHPTDANRARLAVRRLQVSEAERVIARHTSHVDHRVNVADRAAALIASFEGGQSSDGLFHAYWDKYGNVWTIGYGHTGGVSARSRPLSHAQALGLLEDDLRRTYMPPVLALKLPTSNMQVGVIDAVYNLGVGVLGVGHSFGAALHRRDWRGAARVLEQYDHDANGQVLVGLQRRRAAEARLILS